MTLPLFLAAAVEHAAKPGISERFGLDPKYIVMQVISFLIVLFVLYKFGIKPVTATMDERTRKIADGLRYAEDMKAKLEATQQESAALLRQASLDASKLVDEARKTAKDYLDRHTQETAAKVSDMLAKGRQQLDLDQRKMMADARTEIARLVVATTERVLAKKLSDSDRSSYNEAAARELTTV